MPVIYLALLATAMGLVPGPLFAQGNPPIELWLSESDRLERGDRVRVYTRAEQDGYLLVLHAEPDGRIRVLFPLDPVDDHFVRADETYEIRGRGDRHAFQVLRSQGSGAVFASFSRDPFQFTELTRRDHWDYTLDTWLVGDDAEGDLVRLADLMAGGASYEYDLIRYDVGGYIAHGRYGHRLGLYYDHHHHHSWFGLSFHFGDPYGFYYRPFYTAYYYDPFYYDPFYDPYSAYWYDYCWYGPCFYRTYVVYRPRYYIYGYYYPRYYPRYYYPRYYGRSGTRYAVGDYTFKRSATPRVIEPRSRAPLAGAVTRRLLSPETSRGPAVGRRTLAGARGVSRSPTSDGGRRVLNGDPQGTPSRGPSRRVAEPTRQDQSPGRQPGRVTAPVRPERSDPGRREVQDPWRVVPDTRQPVHDGEAALRRELERQELRNRMQQQRPQDTRTPAQPRRELEDRPELRERVRNPSVPEPRSLSDPRREVREPATRARPQREVREAPRPRLERREPPREPRSDARPMRESRPRAEPRSAPPPRSSPPPRMSAPSRPSSPPAQSSPPPRSGGSGGRRRPG